MQVHRIRDVHVMKLDRTNVKALRIHKQKNLFSCCPYEVESALAKYVLK